MAPTVFISHTTRDPRDAALAHRLAAALRARGAAVWIAPESIPAGQSWEEQIVAGILARCTHFLVILSAAAVRAPAVLREIELARGRHARTGDLTVLPLVMGELGHYANHDFVDGLQWIPYTDDFAALLDDVAVAAGIGPAAPPALSAPFDERTRDFVGREYVFADIAGFMADHAAGYFTVEGEPGIGKSAILARYVQRTGSIAHFNVRGLGVTTAAQFLESVCAQLIAKFGLPYASLPPAATRDGTFLAHLLEAAAATGSLAIVVDALDEADSATDSAVNVLFLPSDLPRGVYFVLSRRPSSLPFSVRAPHRVLRLGEEYAEEGIRDVAEFTLRRTLADPRLRGWLAERGLDAAEFSAVVAAKSQGNFMYAHYVLPEIAAHRHTDLDLAELPAGLAEYYEDHWRRMGMRASPLPRQKIRVVYVLSVANRPVSRREIARFGSDADLRLDALTVQEVLDEWEPFLRRTRGEGAVLYSIYHNSFRDFLHRKEIVQASGEDLAGVHGLIADDLWRDLFDAAPP